MGEGSSAISNALVLTSNMFDSILNAITTNLGVLLPIGFNNNGYNDSRFL